MSKRIIAVALAAALVVPLGACTKRDSRDLDAAGTTTTTAASSASPDPTSTTSIGDGSSTTSAPAGSSSDGSGDPSGDGGQSSATSKQEFLDAANAICAGMNDESDAKSQEIAPDGIETLDQMAAMLQAQKTIIDSALAELRALPQPPGDGNQLEAIYQEADALSQIASQMVDAINAGDQATYAALGAELTSQNKALNEKFDDYGLTACGSGADGTGEDT